MGAPKLSVGLRGCKRLISLLGYESQHGHAGRLAMPGPLPGYAAASGSMRGNCWAISEPVKLATQPSLLVNRRMATK